MRYDSIELNKFKRFSLNTIDHFKLTADDRVQIILGTNGCGKSQFFKELSPLPSVSADFNRPGGKKQVISYRGSTYKLSSSFETGGKDVHSFIKDDGEELNPGGTITVQRRLVQDEFGITQDVHELMTSQIRFTSMSASQRRDWLTRLCEEDYTYALEVYNKARVRHRDIQGALKMAKERLVKEQFKAADKTELELLQRNIDALADEHSQLLMLRGRNEKELTKTQAIHNIRHLEQESSALFDKYKALRKNVNWTTFISPEEMTTDLAVKQAELRSIAERVVELSAEYDKLVQELSAASGKEVGTDLQARKKELLERKESLLGALNYQGLYKGEQASVLAEALGSILPYLSDIFTRIPANPGKAINQPMFDSLSDKIDKAKEELGRTDINIQRVEHEISHLEQLRSNGMVDCPECKAKFAPGFDQAKFDRFKKIVQSGYDHRKTAQDKLTKLNAEFIAAKSYMDVYNELEWRIRSIPLLKPLWQHLAKDDLLFESPMECMNVTLRFSEDLKAFCEIETMEVELTRLEDLMVLAQRASEVDVQGVAKRATVIEQELTRLTQSQILLQSRIKKSQEALNSGIKVLEMGDVFTRLGENYDAQVRLYLEAHVNEELDSQIREKSGRLAGLRHEMTKFSELASVVQSIENDIKRLEIQEAAMRLGMDSLSPTEGLIAEGLFGFMKNLVKKVNIVIRGIWSYGMEVQCCSLSDDGTADLDYKFPMMVRATDDSEREPVPDISKGSAGMQEVVDLAFKIVAMRYLGLSDHPLMLDEFGARFDNQHRINATSTIKTLMEELPFSQLWMVSHYAESYMCFPSAQVCVISANNIVVPAEYNTHVELA